METFIMAKQSVGSTAILLNSMPRRPGLLGDDDDWTGCTSSARRKKLQNRINQRAYRKRKREGKNLPSSTFPGSDYASTSVSGIASTPSCLKQGEKAATHSYASLEKLWSIFYDAIGPQYIVRSNLERVGKLCWTKDIDPAKTIRAFQQWVKCRTAASSPSTDCLLVLVKFNVFRALLNNGKTLSFSTGGQYLDHDALSPFANSMYPEESLLLLPLALRPTEIQCQTPHHPWLDLFPSPMMRDNLIRASGAYDEEELCTDLIGLSGASIGRSGLIIWGEPWDPSSWEVTVPFLKHWAWALRNCDELLWATNNWRERRGERLLNFEGVVGTSRRAGS